LNSVIREWWKTYRVIAKKIRSIKECFLLVHSISEPLSTYLESNLPLIRQDFSGILIALSAGQVEKVMS